MATVIYPQSKGLEDLARLVNMGTSISNAYQGYRNRVVNEAQTLRSLGLLERSKQRMGTPSTYDEGTKNSFWDRLFGAPEYQVTGQPGVSKEQIDEQVKLAQYGAGLLDEKTNNKRMDLALELGKENPSQRKVNKLVGDINKGWMESEKKAPMIEAGIKTRNKEEEYEIPTRWNDPKTNKMLITNFNDPRGLWHQKQENLYNRTLKNIEGKSLMQQYNAVLKARRTSYAGDVEGQTDYAKNYDLLLAELRGQMGGKGGRGGKDKRIWYNAETGKTRVGDPPRDKNGVIIDKNWRALSPEQFDTEVKRERTTQKIKEKFLNPDTPLEDKMTMMRAGVLPKELMDRIEIVQKPKYLGLFGEDQPAEIVVRESEEMKKKLMPKKNKVQSLLDKEFGK